MTAREVLAEFLALPEHRLDLPVSVECEFQGDGIVTHAINVGDDGLCAWDTTEEDD